MDPDIQELILQLNREAMNYLKLDQFENSIKTLKYAQEVLNKQPGPADLKLLGITLNNFGCFYKKVMKPNVALKYLTKALTKESVEPVDKVNLAGTLINICAIYSQLGKHQQALKHSLRALALLKEIERGSQNYLTTVVIAYHNTGVEYEFLGCVREAVDCYRSAWELARDQLGEGHSLAGSMKKSFELALAKLEKAGVKILDREQRRTLLGFCRSEKRNQLVSPVASRGVKKRKEVGRNEKGGKDEIVKVYENVKDLEHIRFLTGDRLQPMHPLKQLSRKMRTTGDFAKNTTNSNISRKSNTRGSSRCKIRDTSQTNDLNQVSHTISSPLNIQKPDNPHHKETFITLNNPIQPINPAYPENIQNKSENSPKSLKSLKQVPKPRKFSPLPSDKYKTRSKPSTTPTKPPLIEPKMHKTPPESYHEWMKKQENIEKFETLEEFIKHENELESDPSPIIENLESPSFPNTNPELITKSLFRNYLHRKTELTKINSIIKIQKTIRMHQCRSIYKDIKQAVIFIQSVYRGYSTRKKLSKHTSVLI